jgi:hypothetical protein
MSMQPMHGLLQQSNEKQSLTRTHSHSQFVVIPGKARIIELFEAATGQNMVVGAEWKNWIVLDPSSYAFLLEYIRPCHSQILIDTMDGSTNPAALFRQLLRPYDLTIKAVKKGWTLMKVSVAPAASQTVSDKPGVKIVWS